MYRRPLLMPLNTRHPGSVSTHDTVSDDTLRHHISTLTNQIQALQSKLDKAMQENASLTEQLNSLKRSVRLEKERRALIALKKQEKAKEESAKKMREFLGHTAPEESDDE